MLPASRSAANKINIYISPCVRRSRFIGRVFSSAPRVPPAKGPKPFNQEIVDYSAGPRSPINISQVVSPLQRRAYVSGTYFPSEKYNNNNNDNNNISFSAVRVSRTLYDRN